VTLAFTTSWDDGHPLDLRVAEVLARHGCAGTFYVPRRNSEGRSVLATGELRTLAAGFEIGGHTVDHVRLTRANLDQIGACKQRLQHELGGEVAGFCYPGGHHDATIRATVRSAGFRYARTIERGPAGDPFRVPVTLQLYPHGRITYLKNFARHPASPTELAQLVRAPDLEARIDALLARAHGVFHLWGHSWELQERGLWDLLDRVLARVTAIVPAEHRLTNAAAYAPATSASTSPS
jgi:peptidoglycan/xylan/chitin deacetylase (PgdA/CDA1 family)